MPRPRARIRRVRRVARTAVPIAILIASAIDVAVAFAQATSTTHAQLPASTATINPTLTLTPNCVNKKPVIDISWPTAPEVMNFVLLKANAPNTPKTPAFKTFTNGTTTYQDAAVTLNKSFSYQVTSSFHNWTGASAVVTATTPSKCT